MRDELLIWRLVDEGKATLQELETSWSLDDAVRCSAILDMRGYIEAKLTPKIPKKGRK